jgi:hypothetical protein
MLEPKLTDEERFTEGLEANGATNRHHSDQIASDWKDESQLAQLLRETSVERAYY